MGWSIALRRWLIQRNVIAPAALLAVLGLRCSRDQPRAEQTATLMTQAILYYVATDGSDDNDGSAGAPFATLERARDQIAALKAEGGFVRPVVVNVRQGTYRLAKTFELTKDDSGTELLPITYRAYPGERVRISGARTIAGPWQRHTSNVWRTNVGSFRFQTLFADGQRLSRARMPKTGFYHVVPRKHCVYAPPLVPGPDCYDRFLMRPGDVDAKWRNLSEAQVVTSHRWEQSRYRIDHIEGNQVFVQRGPVGQFFGYDYLADDRYYVDNVFEGIDQGQWYLDNANGDLFYWPKGGGPPAPASVEAGALTTLVGAGHGERYLSWDYLDLGEAPDMAFGTTSFTLSAWLRFPGSGNPEYSLCKGDAWADRGFCLAHYDNAGDATIHDSTLILNDGAHRLFVTAGAWPREEWGHFAWVVDRTSKTATSYVNGVAIHTTDISALGDITSPLPFRIGRIVSSTGDDAINNPIAFLGSIDEPRVYGRALDAGEIQGLYATNTASDEGLLLWLPLEHSFEDASAEAREIVPYGTPAFVAGRFGSGASFNLPVDPPLGFEDYVDDLTLWGFEFGYTDWVLPRAGYGGSQALYAQTSPPALSLTLRRGRFENNTISHTGANGLDVYSVDSRVANNEVVDIGATGIQSGKILPLPLPQYKSALLNRSLEVSNNRVHAVGRVFAEGIGVLFSPSAGNRIAHNSIYDVKYSGISVGWFSDSSMGEVAGHNVVEYNVVHDVMRALNDGGGIYVIGWQPGTVIRHNVVHDDWATAEHASNMLIFGLYVDGTAANITLRDNVAYRNETSGVFMNSYQNGNRNNWVTNNIFVDARGSQVEMHQAKLDTFTHNVVDYSGGPTTPALFGYVAADAIETSNQNLFFTTGDLRRLKTELEAWRAFGFDRDSLVADPLLVVTGETYTLASDSPAYSLGFTGIDPSGNGPVGVECFDDADCVGGNCVQRQCR